MTDPFTVALLEPAFKRIDELERYVSKSLNPVKCADCGLEYGGTGWVDVLVPGWAWARIRPSEHADCGILCFTCITRRLNVLRATNIPIAVVSGPFAAQDVTFDTKEPT